MRRFARRRRGGSTGRGDGPNPLDAGRWLGRVCEASLVEAESLVPLVHDDVPAHLAVVGRPEGEAGSQLVVAVSPRSAGDALLAGLATGARLAAEEGFTGTVSVIAPEWTLAARRRLGLVRAELPYTLRALAAPALAERELAVESEAAVEPSVLRVGQVAAQLGDPVARGLFERAVAALSGLAVKHGGTLRATPRSIELVVLARRVAELRADGSAISLVTLHPQRSAATLSPEGLAGALDALEGQIRRRLNDRRVRDGEEGMRARLLPVLAEACSLRDTVAWPVGGSDHDDVDVVGVDAEGRAVVAAARQTVSLSGLGTFIDAVQALRLSLPTVLAGAAPPVRTEAPRLVVAGEAFASGAVHALSAIALAHELFEIRPDRDHGLTVASIGAEEAMRSLRDRPAWRRRGRGARRDEAEAGAEADKAEEAESEAPGGSAEAEGTSGREGGGREGSGREAGGRGRSRRRRRGGRGREAARPAGEAEAPSRDSEAETPEEGGSEQPRFEELSLFDLEDAGDEAAEEASARGRRPRGRGARRGRRKAEGEGPASGPAEESASGDDEEDEFADEDLAEGLSELPDELEGDTGAARAVGDQEEGEEDGEDEFLSASLSVGPPAEKTPEAEPEPPKRRRRAVVVACADRDSLVSAILLARDIRLLEGLWVYPQEDLMSFFREVATDLRDDVPIHVVGFAPSPAIDVLQAASLYRDRLTWYDHHVWAPEDDMALKQALGEESVNHTPGAGSSLPAVLATSTRRSRFSDKLVDLATGRFTQHDYERWGRLWWWRLGEIAGKRGDVRSDVSSLLTGRPSDLAKEAARAEAPPVPEEVAFVAGRDFRIVHFVGYGMVVAEVPVALDANLVARIARERFAAQLSLVRHEGADLFHFGGDELTSKRVLDFGALVDHLANKLDWVSALPGNDHIARLRVEGLDGHPGRLDEVIGEIAMGRSILER